MNSEKFKKWVYYHGLGKKLHILSWLPPKSTGGSNR